MKVLCTKNIKRRILSVPIPIHGHLLQMCVEAQLHTSHENVI